MKMFKSIVAASAFCIAAMNVTAQTVDEIVAKNITAMGGAEKLNSLKSVKMEGNLSTQGIDIPMSITKVQNKGLRIDLDIMGNANYRVANDKKGWVFMPIMGHTEPQEMDETEFKSAKDQMEELSGTLLNYKAKGITIENVGKETVEGAENYKLKVLKEGKTSFYFIDAKTGFLTKVASKMTFQGQEMDVENIYKDYKQNADGYWFAYTLINAQGPVTLDKITTNATYDDKLFTN